MAHYDGHVEAARESYITTLEAALAEKAKELDAQINYANKQVDELIRLQKEFLKQNFELTHVKQQRDDLMRQAFQAQQKEDRR